MWNVKGTSIKNGDTKENYLQVNNSKREAAKIKIDFMINSEPTTFYMTQKIPTYRIQLLSILITQL